MSRLRAFLHQQKLGVVSTLGPDGAPQSAVVGIAVTDDFEILFDTIESTRKFANLMQNPVCSIAAGWDGANTVQYEGTARRIVSSADNPQLAPYFIAYPDGYDRLSWAGIAHFLVTPRWARYSDFSVTPTFIEIWPS